MPSLFVDDNNAPISDASSLTPFFAAAQTFGVTTGASVVEVTGIGAACTGASQAGPGKRVMVRIATGANDAYYSFAAAGLSGSITSASMVYLPQRWVEYVAIDPLRHVSLYHQQVTAAGALQVTILGSE